MVVGVCGVDKPLLLSHTGDSRRTPNTAFLAWRSSASSATSSQTSLNSSMLSRDAKSGVAASGSYHHLGRPTKARYRVCT